MRTVRNSSRLLGGGSAPDGSVARGEGVCSQGDPSMHWGRGIHPGFETRGRCH